MGKLRSGNPDDLDVRGEATLHKKAVEGRDQFPGC